MDLILIRLCWRVFQEVEKGTVQQTDQPLTNNVYLINSVEKSFSVKPGPLQRKFYGDNLSMTNGKNRQRRRQSLFLPWYSRFQNFEYETRPELRL